MGRVVKEKAREAQSSTSRWGRGLSYFSHMKSIEPIYRFLLRRGKLCFIFKKGVFQARKWRKCEGGQNLSVQSLGRGKSLIIVMQISRLVILLGAKPCKIFYLAVLSGAVLENILGGVRSRAAEQEM